MPFETAKLKNCPVGPVVKIASVAWGTGSIPDWGTKIPYDLQCGHKKKKLNDRKKLKRKPMYWEVGCGELLSWRVKIQIFRFRTLVQTSSTY